MNSKGIRERKLLEGLRKSKDRLKLKKAKKLVQDVSMEADADLSKKDSEEMSKEATYVANEIPFIFRTSNLA
jgi:hypothetical protein